jgi:hypothetical protein
VGRMLGDPGQDVGRPSLRINIVHFGGDDQAVHRAARWSPRSEPASNHDSLPSAMPLSARSAALLTDKDQSGLNEVAILSDPDSRAATSQKPPDSRPRRCIRAEQLHSDDTTVPVLAKGKTDPG